MLLRRSNSTVSIKNIINLTGLTRHTQSIGEFLKNKYTSDQFNMYITLMNERLTTKAVVIDGAKEYSVEFEELRKMCGYSTKGNAKRVLENQLQRDKDWVSLIRTDKRAIGATTVENIYLTLDAAQHFALQAKTEQGGVIRQFFIEVAKQLRSGISTCSSNEATQALHSV